MPSLECFGNGKPSQQYGRPTLIPGKGLLGSLRKSIQGYGCRIVTSGERGAWDSSFLMDTV